ncbi:MAG: NAD(P)H-hydrate dehydratase, partial [Spirochaetaceae bacterium]|nr:NAD(P)H-hydrate dehydratase [Spirochaetaceae bacterium]
MKSLFFDTRPLDARAKTELCLTTDILMENAAMALEERVMCFAQKYAGCSKKLDVLIVCGSGDNGADGIVLARRLKGRVSGSALIEPYVLQVLPPKSQACISQTERALKVGVKFTDKVFDAALVVDCLFGSGFHGILDPKIEELIVSLNNLQGYKLACDVPSALDCAIKNTGTAFIADETVTMGAGKIALYLDGAKDYAGSIYTVSLGISDAVFEGAFKPDAMLLEEADLRLPSRKKLNVHKGSFGHAAIVCGTKPGAAIMAASSALRFGAGLVSLVNPKAAANFNVPCELMLADQVPENAGALALGMGLGMQAEDSAPYIELLKSSDLPAVLDADMFYSGALPVLLAARSSAGAKTILTPHPKEFAVLLKNCGLADVSPAEIQKDRCGFAKMFCTAYKDSVLLLKGATPLIALSSGGAEAFEMFFNPHGSPVLAKGGSGDVLSGLIAALLAQGY